MEKTVTQSVTLRPAMEIYRILKPICHLEMRHVTASEAEMLWIMHDFKPYHRIEKD